jgi:2-oxoisovalerate dehydrogenase E1 component alpha subunit
MVRQVTGTETPVSHDALQLIHENGERIHHDTFSALIDDIGPAELRRLYQDLVVVRRIDAEATALQRQGQIGLWAPLLGQEAAQVGSAGALTDNDYVFPSYREHGVAYCRGADPAALLQQWRGSAPSSWLPSELRMAAPAIVVGAQALHGVGYAMGMKLDGSGGAAIAYFGDGATSQGDISEAFTFAASWHVPVVFFCQNNQWAISEPVRVQSQVPLSERGAGFGVPGIRVDGNDVLAVLAATRFALQQARSGGGPTLIEAVTYRMGPHTTSDDPTRYRDQAELDGWRAKDPIERVRLLLEREGQLDDDQAAAVARAADEVAAQVREGCLNTSTPLPESLFEHVYAEPHPLINEQRIALAEHLASFDTAPSLEGTAP